MARRFKRRRRYTWFPNLGTAASNENPDDNVSGLTIFLTGVGPNQVTGVAPLTFDQPSETGDTFSDENLGEILQNEYIVRRIVGNWFVNLAEQGAESSTLLGENTAVLVTAGIAVARADDAATDPNVPAGGDTIQNLNRNFRPSNTQTIREPWLFRRSWMLGCGPVPRTDVFGQQIVHEFNSVDSVANNTTHNAYPSSNIYYGGMMSGAFVDSRVMRRVSNDDRLWAVISAQNFPAGFPSTGVTRTVVSYFDYRILGALRRAKNKGSF